MNDTKIASKAKAQLSNFMGKVFTHFSKPTKRIRGSKTSWGQSPLPIRRKFSLQKKT